MDKKWLIYSACLCSQYLLLSMQHYLRIIGEIYEKVCMFMFAILLFGVNQIWGMNTSKPAKTLLAAMQRKIISKQFWSEDPFFLKELTPGVLQYQQNTKLPGYKRNTLVTAAVFLGGSAFYKFGFLAMCGNIVSAWLPALVGIGGFASFVFNVGGICVTTTHINNVKNFEVQKELSPDLIASVNYAIQCTIYDRTDKTTVDTKKAFNKDSKLCIKDGTATMGLNMKDVACVKNFVNGSYNKPHFTIALSEE